MITKKNPRIARFFASLPFLTYLRSKRLKPSTCWDQFTRKKRKKIEPALNKWNDHCINGMFVFIIFMHVPNQISKSTQKTAFSHLTQTREKAKFWHKICKTSTIIIILTQKGYLTQKKYFTHHYNYLLVSSYLHVRFSTHQKTEN